MIEIEKQVARYQELHKQASNGPWTWELGMSGQNWPICNVGAGDTGETYWVTTDNVRASEVNSSGPQVDAEFIALSRNLAQPLLDAWGLRKILIAKIVELNSHTQQWDDINDAVTSIKAQRDALAAENKKLATEVRRLRALIVGFKDEHFVEYNGEMECGCDKCLGFYEVSP